MRKLGALLCLASVLLFVLPLLAQKTAEDALKYDTSKETTIKGTVEEVKEIANAKGQIGIHLMLKAGADVVEVRLCPNSYLKEFDVVFHKGDQLTVTGSKLRVDDKDVVLAREIEAGNSKVVLRDNKGAPVWTWLTKGGSK